MDIKNTEVFGFQGAIRGMRNAYESWSKSDSGYCSKYNCNTCDFYDSRHGCDADSKNEIEIYIIGKNDMKLAQTLLKGNGSDWKFMRMIHVQADFNMPRYWWSEMDTYHFNTKNSCSTMHKLLNNKNPITLDMFEYSQEDREIMTKIILELETMRIMYKNNKDGELQRQLLVRAKKLLPESFLQMRTFDTNYAELRNIYFQRRNHLLKEEWGNVVCKWIESLPYAKELICYENPIDNK